MSIPRPIKSLDPMTIPLNSRVLVRTDGGKYVECVLVSYSDEFVGCPVATPVNGGRSFGIGYFCKIVSIIQIADQQDKPEQEV